MKRFLAFVLALLGTANVAFASAPTDRARTMRILQYAGVNSRDIKFVDAMVNNQSPEWEVYFDIGASKGLNSLQSDYTAYDSTAATMNFLQYGPITLGAMMIVDGGNTVPVADAEGLDITAGNVTNNDHVAYFAGLPGTVGRPLIPGTDPAFKLCATTKIHDVSGTDGYFIGFATTEPATVALASYTDYCGVHIKSGTIYVADKTTGDTTTTDSWANDASKTVCVLVSSARACTYTIDGDPPTATDAHSLGAGVPVIPRFQLLHDSDGADDTWISYAGVLFQ